MNIAFIGGRHHLWQAGVQRAVQVGYDVRILASGADLQGDLRDTHAVVAMLDEAGPHMSETLEKIMHLMHIHGVRRLVLALERAVVGEETLPTDELHVPHLLRESELDWTVLYTRAEPHAGDPEGHARPESFIVGQITDPSNLYQTLAVSS